MQEWIAEPNPAWEKIADAAALGRFQRRWLTRKPSYGYDDQIFKMVALDRFLQLWFP